MSYPRSLQVLIIDDRPEMKEYYDEVFLSFHERVCVSSYYAFSYQDALKMLERDTIYHLVILDLQLPEVSNRPPVDNLDFGLTLFESCVNRDSYPIPALLVISGYLSKANQSALEDRVRKGFSYGRVLVKGGDLQTDIGLAVQAVLEYCDIGVHIRDGGAAKYPTLSPREDDLLRRAILDQQGDIGVDLKWWCAEYDSPTGEYAACTGWTKTLMGHFLLPTGKSQPTFFKFFPAEQAHHVLKDAATVQQMLGHIHVCSSRICGDRSLLVTRKVGSGPDDPVSLAELLSRPSAIVLPVIPRLVDELGSQVTMLGADTPDCKKVKELLWKYHDADKLTKVWDEYKQGIDEIITDPIDLFYHLRSIESWVSYTSQPVLHGDLNFTNVAIDLAGCEYHAYIFDASGCGGGVNIRDLATLEVTSMLHQPLADNESMVSTCASLYRKEADAIDEQQFAASSDRERNTWQLVTEIRRVALSLTTPAVYALMVYDAALLQLGGLAFGITNNKITRPNDAARLAFLTAQWLQKQAPEWCTIKPIITEIE